MTEDRLAELLDQAVPPLGTALDGYAVVASARRFHVRRRMALAAGVLVAAAGVGTGFALGQSPGGSSTLAVAPTNGSTTSPSQAPVVPTPSPSPGTPLVPVDPGGPAAGICGTATTQVALVMLRLDVPSPRCTKVRPGQLLRIVNSTNSDGQAGEAITVTLRGFDPTTLQPGEGYTFPKPLSDVLAPGYHRTSGGLHGVAELLVQG